MPGNNFKYICKIITEVSKKFQIKSFVRLAIRLMRNALKKRVNCTILYATETGKSENFAKGLYAIFKHAFNTKVC